jgi:hypothetical protein
MRPYMSELAVPQRRVTPPVGNLREVGQVRIALGDLDRLGPPNHEDDPEAFFAERGAPPHPCREWWLQAACGLSFVLCQDFVTEEVVVVAEEAAELEHMLAHLPFDYEGPYRLEPEHDERERREGRGGWVVLREDDRGNRFDIESFSRESSARCYARLLELRRHKQTYLVEARGELPVLPPEDSGPGRWVLVRQDDHGGRVVVRRAASRRFLEFLAEAYNREPRHKQTWLVERGDAPLPK